MPRINAVEMKDSLQALARESRGEKDEGEALAEFQRHLRESDVPLAQKWRRMRQSKKVQPKSPAK